MNLNPFSDDEVTLKTLAVIDDSFMSLYNQISNESANMSFWVLK